MTWTALLFWLLPRHLRSSWVLLAITFVGVLSAVTLMATGAVYSRALAEGGLRHTFANASPSVLNIRLTVQNRPLGPADYSSLRTDAERIIDERVSFLVRETQRHGKAQAVLPLVVNTDAEVPYLGGPVGRPYFLTDFEDHAQLVAGRWPENGPTLHDNGVDLEATVGREAARLMGIESDSRVFLAPFRDDPSQRINIHVVGLMEPREPDEEYWMGGSAPFFELQDYGDNPVVSFYVRESTFFDGLGSRYPSLVGDYEWFIYTDPSVVTVGTVQSTRDALNGLETDINKRFPRSTVLTYLENSRGSGLLATYQRDLTLARVPVFLFLAMVVMVTLYFLAVVVGLLAKTRNDEASLLRSRGASLVQVSSLLVAGEAIVVIIATILGPFLALFLARQFILRTINPSGGGVSSIGLSLDMFAAGAIGGLLCLAVLILSSVALARLGILEFLRARARPATVPFLHRYYVDVLLVAVLVVLLWQAQGRRGFISQALTGRGLELDTMLLFGPALALIVAAFLMLRVLPMITRLLARVSYLFAPSWATFTLTRMSRDPLPYGSLTVIVLLATALGVFGSAFQSTLSRSQQEQALYGLGGDLVVTGLSLAQSPDSQSLRELTDIPGVRSVSPLFRGTVRPLDGSVGTSTALLAIESTTLPEAGWFRDDFSPTASNLSELLVPLRGRDYRLPTLSGYLASGIPIPESAERVGLWVNADNLEGISLAQSPTLRVRLMDSKGRYQNLDLGLIGIDEGPPVGWEFLEAVLPERANFEPPLSLVSIFVTAPSVLTMPPGNMYFDDLTAIPAGSAAGTGEVIERFEEPALWVALPHQGDQPDRIEVATSAAKNGRSGLRFGWTDTLRGNPRGALIPPGPFPLSAIGGPGFQEGQAVRLSVDREIILVRVEGVVDYFPTVTTSSRRFILVSMEQYNDYLRRIGGGVERPNEYWISVDESVPRNQVIAALRDALPSSVRIQDRDSLLESARRNPLAGGGWDGLTILSVAALALAVVVTLSTHAIVSVGNSKVDLTVTRILGFSGIQLIMSFVLDRMIVTIVGMVSGAVVGLLLSKWVLELLETTASGRDIIPPVIFTANIGLIALTLVCLLAAAALAVGLAAFSARRLRPSDILRATE